MLNSYYNKNIEYATFAIIVAIGAKRSIIYSSRISAGAAVGRFDCCHFSEVLDGQSDEPRHIMQS